MIERRLRITIVRSLGYGAVAAGLVLLGCERQTPPSSAATAEDADPAPPTALVRDQGSAAGQLYVIDGAVVETPSLGDIQNLEIETMEVVAGTAAEARYGERAKNGAVVITTKAYAATLGTLRGTVLGPNGTPVASARVVIVGVSLVAVTDAQGAYALAVPAGTYAVRAEFGGFKPTEMSGVQILAGETLTADFKLSEGPARP